MKKVAVVALLLSLSLGFLACNPAVNGAKWNEAKWNTDKWD